MAKMCIPSSPSINPGLPFFLKTLAFLSEIALVAKFNNVQHFACQHKALHDRSWVGAHFRGCDKVWLHLDRQDLKNSNITCLIRSCMRLTRSHNKCVPMLSSWIFHLSLVSMMWWMSVRGQVVWGLVLGGISSNHIPRRNYRFLASSSNLVIRLPLRFSQTAKLLSGAFSYVLKW